MRDRLDAVLRSTSSAWSDRAAGTSSVRRSQPRPLVRSSPRLHFLRAASFVVVVFGLALTAAAAHAQTGAPFIPGGPRRPQATRAELESLVVSLERHIASGQPLVGGREMRERELQLMKRRLSEGDIQVGDRVILRVVGDSTLTDTFTVRTGRVLELPRLEGIPLAGVLRAELQGHLTQALSRYLRQPEVQATALIRVAVLGEVRNPGFYALPPDAQISDAIMAAGGPAANADLARTTIRRDGVALWGASDVRTAVNEGYTLDQLYARAGDEVVVGERRRTNWQALITTGALVASLALTILSAASND